MKQILLSDSLAKSPKTSTVTPFVALHFCRFSGNGNHATLELARNVQLHQSKFLSWKAHQELNIFKNCFPFLQEHSGRKDHYWIAGEKWSHHRRKGSMGTGYSGLLREMPRPASIHAHFSHGQQHHANTISPGSERGHPVPVSTPAVSLSRTIDFD